MWRKWRIVLAALVALALAGGAAVLATAGPPAQTVLGKVTVYSGSCPPSGGYSDIHAGTSVQVTDGSGDLVALGRISPAPVPGYDGSCQLWFEVPDVPGGHDFYGVEVANRGKVMFERDRVFDANEVDLSIGDPLASYLSYRGGY